MRTETVITLSAVGRKGRLLVATRPAGILRSKKEKVLSASGAAIWRGRVMTWVRGASHLELEVLELSKQIQLLLACCQELGKDVQEVERRMRGIWSGPSVQ